MRWMTAVLALACAIGCKEKPAEEMGATPGKSTAMGPAGAAGSAMGTKMPDASAPVAVDAAVAPKSPDDIAKQYEQCIHLPQQQRWDAYKACFAPGAKWQQVGLGEPSADFVTPPATAPEVATVDESIQLQLISGHALIAIVLVTAQDAATKQTVTYYTGRVVGFDDAGLFTGVREFVDIDRLRVPAKYKAQARPMPKGLAQKESLIAKGDDVERANLATFGTLFDAYAKHDAAAFGALFADDAVVSFETVIGKDVDKKALVAKAVARWKVAPDLRYTVESSWAAGNYVAAIATLTGTVKGKALAVPLLVIFRFADGKVKQGWQFYPQRLLEGSGLP